MKKVLIALTVLTLLSGAKAAPAQVKARVGVSLIVSYLPLFMALENGYTKEEGLAVEMINIPGGPKKLEALAGGSLEFAGASMVPIIQGAAQGLDFTIVAPMANVADTPPDTSGVVVRKDSGIDSIKDLAGKKIAISATKQIDDLTTAVLVKRKGGDPKSITWVEMPYGQHPSALAHKLVDAAYMIDPFLANARSDPSLKILTYTIVEVTPGEPLVALVTTGRWLEKNSDVAFGLSRAMKKAIQHINANTAEARKIIPKYTQMKPEVAAQVALNAFKPSFSVSGLQTVADLMLEFGWLNKKVDVSRFVHASAR